MATLPKWADLLIEYNNNVNGNDNSNDELDYSEKLGLATTKLFDSANNDKKKCVDNKIVIPPFFTNANDLKKNQSLIAVVEIARELFLDNNEEKLLSEHDLDCLFNNMITLLKQYRPTNTSISENNNNNNLNCFLNYEMFRELKQLLPKRAHKFLTASVFRKFPLNQYGALRGISFHQFVSLSLNLLHQFITLCRYDISTNITNNNKSYLTESDLEIFIGDQIEMIPCLMNIDDAFHPYYIYHAVRKFMFCLNSCCSNSNLKKRIQVTKILCSDTFREFNEFRFIKDTAENSNNINNNWFSVENALRVYKMYLTLDEDHNGTLSQKEMLQFNQSSLSNLCIQRIFQYKKTWDQEMDYKGFLNFVLAVEHKNLIQSLDYFWDILDLDGNGYLTPLTIHTLFRSVQKKMGIFGLDPINTDDVLNEIIDMVNPKNKEKVTKKDLINSKMFSTVVNILTDVKGFWEYDNREALAVEQQ